MARVVVTGGAGFIGTALRRELAAAGHAVICADVVAEADMRADVTRAVDCARICADADVVVHGAAIHRADDAAGRPAEMIRINVHGTANLLRAAAAAGVGRFVLLSTAKVYGDAGAADEDDLPRPADPYGLTKFGAEALTRRIHDETGLPASVVRPFSVYGPGQDLHTGYVGMLLRALRDDATARLPGAPDFRRDFVCIDDVCALCTAIIDAALPGYTVFNAASGQASRLGELVRLTERAAGRAIDVEYVRPRDGTLRVSAGRVDRARRQLGLPPATPLAAGVARTVDWLLGARRCAAADGP